MSHQFENASYSGSSSTESDQDLTTKILSVLQEIRTPSAFAYSAEDSSLPNPVLDVPPYGILGLPLSTEDAQKIISQASRSPFGQGEATLVDPSVRKSWELNPNQFSLKNPAWNEAIKKIVDTVVTGLGLENATGKVSAELYKLLLYEPGAFFKPHKDSEKAPGMFGTLVVCLPSLHEGGKLVLKHEHQRYEFETANSSSFGYSYAAWYSDITHAVLPVTFGYRLMLTYHLIRRADLRITSYNLVQGRSRQLLALLEQYNLRLEAGDTELPPILMHKLEHKYTQANLKLNTLKPPDFAQVHTLSLVPGFHIYLATLELEVRTDEDHDDCLERSESLKNMVELDGKLVAQDFEYPDDALLDPTPQDEDEHDESEHEGFTGNAGCPVTLWYRDTVVILVPPSKQLDFMFEFKHNGRIIGPLFSKLLQIFLKDPAQRPKLEQLCELALKQNPTDSYLHRYQVSSTVPSYYKQAVATALDLGRFDLFDAACKTVGDGIMLNNAHMLGHWTAAKGLPTMKDRLMRGVQIASSVAGKIQFLKSVAEGFQSVMQEPGSIENANLKHWSDQAIFSSTAQMTSLSKADGMSLAQLCKTTDWNLFESKVKPVVLNAATAVKITFINELMSNLQQELDEKQREFVKVIIHFIWNKFVFETDCQKPVSQPSSSLSWLQNKKTPVKKDYLCENDILHLVKNTVKIFTSETVENMIIPAMLNAIPNVGQECTKNLLLPLAQMILTNKLVGFQSAIGDVVPPSLHKRLIQALLTKFLLETVGPEPAAPTNWSFPPRNSCHCDDCYEVNKFLQNPVQQVFDFPLNKQRRYHLHQNFTDHSKHYSVTTIRQGSPYTWRITKHRRGFDADKAEWIKKTKSAVDTLSTLEGEWYYIAENDGNSVLIPMESRLESYLQPYYRIIMDANVKQLPNLQLLVTVPQSSGSNENVARNQLVNQGGHKRGADNIDVGLAKRTRP